MLLDSVSLFALGFELEVGVPVLDRFALLTSLLVGLPRREVRLGLVTLELRSGGICIPSLLVRSLALLLVRQRLGSSFVDLAEVERDDGVSGGGFAPLLQNLRRLICPASLDIETGETPYNPGVLRVVLEFLFGPRYLLIGARGLFFLPLG